MKSGFFLAGVLSFISILPTYLPFNFFSAPRQNLESVIEQNPSGMQATMVEICDNGIDDDGDGLIDCFDDDCFNTAECEGFYYGGGAVSCTFVPPVLPNFELEKLYCTDYENYPIDQRASAYVGDMDGDGIPEIVSNDPSPGRIQIFSGLDGTIKQSIVVENNHPFSQLALADVDSDGLGDIFRNENGNILARYEYGNPNPIWKTPANVGDNTTYSDPQVADFDGDGVPEVYLGNRIFNSIDGTRLAVGTGNQGIHVSGDRYTLAYDVFKPGDPKPGGGVFGPEAAGLELLAGNQVYTVDLGDGTLDNGSLTVVSEISGVANVGDGFVSIGDIDDDGLIDIIIVDGGKIYVWNPRTETLIGSVYDIPGTVAGGRANVGDFDNDGMAEIGTAGRNIYVVVEYNPANNMLELKWQKTGLDDGSQRTGSTLFDFEGDGSNEVVYSEEGHLFVYDGATGNEIAKIPSLAGTRTEYPLVADVNGDGAAEIIVTDQNGNGPGFSGNDFICVYRSLASPWVSARPVWNQHGYFNTNINDDLTVPPVQQDILDPSFGNAFNGFLVQSTILSNGSTPAFAAPDATIEILDIDNATCPDLTIEMKVKNIGSTTLPGVTPIAFYDDNPTTTAANLIGTSTIGTTVEDGDSTTFTYALSTCPPMTPLDIYVVVNDTGFVANLPYDFNTDFPVTGTPECDFTNNMHMGTSPVCLEICGDGIDNDCDGLVDEPNITAPDTTGCSGDVLAQMTIDLGSGTWSVISSIGTTVSATGVVTLGTNHSAIADVDTIIYNGAPCPDTIFVTTLDDEDPQLQCPGNANVALNTVCQATLADYTGNTKYKDNCSATSDITISQMPVSGTTIGIGVTTVTMTVTDEAGNDTQCTFEITGVDNIDPSIICPANLTAQVDNACDYTLLDYTGSATVADNCSATANIDITQSPPTGTIISGDGTTQIVMLTAEDESGNTRQCTFQITLEDTVDPTVSCPANQNIIVDNNCNATLANYTSLATCADNCTAKSDIVFSQTPTAGTLLSGAGTTQVVTIGVDDGNGNTASCNFTITLIDNIAPQITCPANKNFNVDGSCEYDLANYTSEATVSDNCTATGSITVTQSPVATTTISGNGTVQTVTLTANDGNGNTTNCTFNITLQDPIKPTITCPANKSFDVDGSCEFDLGNYTSEAAVSDNCTAVGDIAIAQAPAAGTTISGDGTVQTITLTATDDQGNNERCTFTITLNDNTNPSITCPMNQNLSVNAMCAIDLPDYTSSATVTDNCTANGSISVTQSPIAGTTLMGDGTMQVLTLTANDGNGNTAQCTFTVTLEDNSIPAITCPANKDVSVNGSCQLSLANYTNEAGVVGVCDPPSAFTITQSPAPGTSLSGVGTTQTIILNADDMMGQMNSCTFQITLVDDTPPSLTCPANANVNLNASCNFSVPTYSATVSDNCTANGAITLTQVPTAGTILTGADVTQNIVLTANDGNGNTTQCTFTIRLKDVTNPSITCPANQTEALDGNCELSIPDYTSATVSDNCTLSGNINVSQSPISGTTLNGHNVVQTITLTADDGNGNTTQCTFNLTTDDDTDPVINCPVNQDLILNASCQVALPDFTSSAITSDNCAAGTSLTVSQSPVVGTTLTGANITQTITLTANDGNGNTTQCTFTIRLKDVTNPSITCPANQSVSLDLNCEIVLADYTSSATISDNCTANASITTTQLPAPGTTLTGAESVIQITIQADDGNGNMTSCNFNLTLDDDTDPSLTCPANSNVNVDGNCEFQVPDYSSSLTLSDNCTANADINISQSPPIDTILTGDNTAQTITMTANDGNGNSISCAFVITLQDITDPTIVCPTNQDVAVDNNCEISLGNYTNSASVDDNCTPSASISVTQMPVAGTTLSTADFMQTVTLTANDGNGNTAQCTFIVTLKDETAPDNVCPSNQTLLADNNCEISVPDFTGLSTIGDNCSANGDIVMTQVPVVGTTFSGHGTLGMVTVTATDESGNSTDCTFNFTIQDEVDPTIACPANQTVNPDGDCQFTIPDYTSSAVVADNCTSDGAVIVTQVAAAGTVLSGDGTSQTITLTANDGNGNTAQCTFDVTLDDNTPAVATCPANQTISVDDVCAVSLPDYTMSAAITDNCAAPAQITVTQAPVAGGSYSGDGTVINVTLTVNDGNGNTSNCTFDVTLEDTTDPALTCPGNQDLFADGSCEVAISDYLTEVAVTNECMMGMGISLSQAPVSGTTLSGKDFVQTITVTADDGNGNMTSCTFDVTVRDTVPPLLTCPASFTDAADDNCQYEVLDFRDSVTLSDNCAANADITLTQSPLPTSLFEGYGIPHMIEITAVDECGNISTCDFTVTLTDTIPPFVACPDDQEISIDENCSGLIPNYTSEASKTDNCHDPANITLTQMPAPGTPYAGHGTSQTITITADDGQGNTSNCTFELTLNDEIDPEIICPVDFIVDVNDDCELILPDYSNLSTVDDNCTADAMISITQAPIAGTILAGYNTTHLITHTANDGNGNTKDCDFEITLDDNIAPNITCPTTQIEPVNSNCEFNLPDYTSDAVISDNCAPNSLLTVIQTPAPGTTYVDDSTVQVVTLTIDDSYGNSAQCTFEVILDDDVDPEIICPENQEIFLDDACEVVLPDYTAFANIGDNCTDLLDLVVTQSPAPNTTYSGSITSVMVTLTVDDGNGNTEDCLFEVSFLDITNPEITCPEDFARDLDSNCEYVLEDFTSLVIGENECANDLALTITQSPVAGTVLNGMQMVHTIFFTATDNSGNMTTCDVEITLNDITPPQFSCPGPQTIRAKGCQVEIPDYTSELTAIDDCDNSTLIIFSQSPLPGSILGAGVHVITCSATDTEGNTSTCNFNLEIILEEVCIPIGIQTGSTP